MPVISKKLDDEIGTNILRLDKCEHDQFCYTCILKWSKRQNTCPVCREPFKEITRYSLENIEPETISVESKTQSLDNYTIDPPINTSHSSDDSDLSPESESNFIRL